MALPLSQSCFPLSVPDSCLFIDGSKSVDGCGCAVWCGAFTLFSHLPSSSSVFTAELFAIYSALKFLQNIDGQYVLYSDSLSCIRALQSLAPSSHYLISKIVFLLLSLPSHKVVIEWVPCHVGIPGNKADHLARTAITHPHIINLPHITPELRPVIMSSYYQLWSDHWTSLPLPLRLPLKPPVPHGSPIVFFYKKSFFQCWPPKTDFRFLIYTPKNIWWKITFFLMPIY